MFDFSQPTPGAIDARAAPVALWRQMAPDGHMMCQAFLVCVDDSLRSRGVERTGQCSARLISDPGCGRHQSAPLARASCVEPDGPTVGERHRRRSGGKSAPDGHMMCQAFRVCVDDSRRSRGVERIGQRPARLITDPGFGRHQSGAVGARLQTGNERVRLLATDAGGDRRESGAGGARLQFGDVSAEAKARPRSRSSLRRRCLCG